MIIKQEILDRAKEWQLRPDVVEKDYVIGWVLWAIGNHPTLSHEWVFKGGTCLKKCFIETYRFSEDIDFTVLPGGPLKAQEVQPIISAMLQSLATASGIDFTGQPPMFRDLPSGVSTEGRIYYRGPMGTPTVASIKLDITGNEKVVRPSVLRPIAHTYPDTPPSPNRIRCYGFEELFAEKLRALGERFRPRDLYDVINLFRRRDLRSAPHLIRTVLDEKCRSKSVPIPAYDALVNSPYKGELESEWSNMLAHQLPVLPPLQSFLDELKTLFDWLEGKVVLQELPVISAPGEATDDTWRPPPTVWQWGQGVPLEAVRFAGANRLCIDLGYNGSVRRVEPYSLRRSRAGNILFYARKVATGEDRSYRVDRIQSITVTTQPFIPKYEVEFTPAGDFSIPHLVKPSVTRTRALYRPRRIRASGNGPTHIIECNYCQRRFRRKTRDTSLRPHKDAFGSNCSGRRGFLIDTVY